MKASNRKILSLMTVMLLVLVAAFSSACSSNKPIDESQLPDLEATQQEENQQEQTGEAEAVQPEEAQNDETETLLSEDRVKEIVLDKVPGASGKHISSFGREFDDGRWIYEGEIRYDGLEYDFEIDAQTGNILEWEIDD